MNAMLGWPLALAALVIGYVQYGWPGVAMAATVVVFWLLLQFNRAVRVMRNAGSRPVGHVGSAVMLNARLKPGMRMLEIVTLTRSLGQRLSAPDEQPERWCWRDNGGVAVELTLERGRCTHWQLVRPPASDSTP